MEVHPTWKKENTSAEKKGGVCVSLFLALPIPSHQKQWQLKYRKKNPDRLCTMHYDTGLYSAGCKEAVKHCVRDELTRINPISAGVLENQDMLIGGQFDPPPSKSHVWCPNMTNDTSLESFCALLLESANLQIWKNWIFYRKIHFYSKNVCKNKLSKKRKVIHFWKALDHAISNMQKFWQNFK